MQSAINKGIIKGKGKIMLALPHVQLSYLIHNNDAFEVKCLPIRYKSNECAIAALWYGLCAD